MKTKKYHTVRANLDQISKLSMVGMK